MERPSQLKATVLGVLALFFWALSPYIISELHNIPTFQLSGTVFLIAFLYTSVQLTRKREWRKINPTVVVLLVGFAAILNNQAAYIYAVKLIPPEQVEIIYYSWPILVLIISGLFLESKRSFLPIISALFGLAGIYVLLTDGKGFGEITVDRSEGYLFAMIAAGSWVTYSLFSRYNPGIPLEMNGIWCGMSAIPCFAINCYCEGLVMPTFYEWLLLAFIGIGILSFSLNMWTTGLRYGHFTTLSAMSYMTPLLSVLFLMLTGKTGFKSTVLISCQLVILGGALCVIVEWCKKRLVLSPVVINIDMEKF